MRRLVFPLLLLAASPAMAEVELSFYGGWQGAPGGGVTLSGDSVAPDGDVDAEDAFGSGGQYGLRSTWWSDGGFGVALDYSHIDGEGDGADGLTIGSLDTFTVNGLHRWEEALGGMTPYVGAGLGYARAEVDVGGEDVRASGPAVSWFAGASVPITDSLSIFGEYRGTLADTEGDPDGGGSVQADPVTNSINLGVSFSF